MNTEIIMKAIYLASKIGYVLVATSDARGWSHIGIAGKLASLRDNHIAVTEWFCPGTMSNLQANPKMSIVVWDSLSDTGFQLLGELEEIKELGIIDGYSPEVESQKRVPQVERQLLVHIDKVLKFKRAPHTDIPENEKEIARP